MKLVQLVFLSLAGIPAAVYLYTGIVRGRHAFTAGALVLALIPMLTSSPVILSAGFLAGAALPFFAGRFFRTSGDRP